VQCVQYMIYTVVKILIMWVIHISQKHWSYVLWCYKP
jgi:hypothetical protein